MTIYKSRFELLRNVGFPVLLLFGVLWMAVVPEVFMKALFILFAGYAAWHLLNLPISLTLTDDGRLLFRSTVKTTDYLVQDIARVRLSKSEDGDYAFLKIEVGGRNVNWQAAEKENRDIVAKLLEAQPSVAVLYE
jgi:hypothetical protein